MPTYLAEVRFAANSVVDALWEDQRQIDALESELDKLRKVVVREYNRAEAMMSEDDDLDTYLAGVATHWDTYFGPDKELYHEDQKLAKVVQRLAARHFSLDTLAAALLQHAKQGISLVHGKLGTAPSGRMIGSQALKTVIWQGRNQALHWEDHKFQAPTDACFKTLVADIAPGFADYVKRNMAFDVVRALGWKDLAAFEADMLSLS